MNKAELIHNISIYGEITKQDAELAVNALLGEITMAMHRGNDVTLQGFGTFSVKTRQARTGRNPQTGETMDIPASQYVAFKPGKTLKEAVN